MARKKVEKDDNSYLEVIDKAVEALARRNISAEDKFQIATSLLSALKIEYDKANDNNSKRKLCYIAIDNIKPCIEVQMFNRHEIDDKLFFEYYNLYYETLLFSARKSFKYFLLAMEFKRMKKVWEFRIDLFEPLIYYLEEMYFHKKEMELIRASFPPRIW